MLNTPTDWNPFVPPQKLVLKTLVDELGLVSLSENPDEKELTNCLRKPLIDRLECMIAPVWYDIVWKTLHLREQRTMAARVRMEETLGWTRKVIKWDRKTAKRPSWYVWKGVDAAGKELLLGALQIPPDPEKNMVGDSVWSGWTPKSTPWNADKWRMPGVVIWEQVRSEFPGMAKELATRITLDLLRGTFRRWTEMVRMGSGLKHPPSHPIHRATETEQLDRLLEEYTAAYQQFVQHEAEAKSPEKSAAQERMAECVSMVLNDENCRKWYRDRKLNNHLNSLNSSGSVHNVNSFLCLLLFGRPVPFQTAIISGVRAARERMLLPEIEYDADHAVHEKIVVGWAARCPAMLHVSPGKNVNSPNGKKCGHVRSETRCHREGCPGGPVLQTTPWLFGSNNFQEMMVFKCKQCGSQAGRKSGSLEFVETNTVPCPRCKSRTWSQRPKYVMAYRQQRELGSDDPYNSAAASDELDSQRLADHVNNPEVNAQTRGFLSELASILGINDLPTNGMRTKLVNVARLYIDQREIITKDLNNNELYFINRQLRPIWEAVSAENDSAKSWRTTP